MSQKNYAGNAASTKLTSSISSSDLSFTVESGSNYPESDFVVTIDRGLASEEKVLVGSRSGDLFSVDPSGRGFDDTTAQSHAVESVVMHTIDADSMNDFSGHIYDPGRNDHTQYAQTSHDHAASDVISGQLEVERGGTGAGSASVARTNLGVYGTDEAVASTTVRTIWTGSQAAYDALDPVDPETLYVVVD